MIEGAGDAMIEALHPFGAPTDEEVQHYTDEDAPQRTWVPADAMQADWVARKVLRARAAMEQIQADYEAQRALLDAYREAAMQPHKGTEAWGEGVLQVYVRQEIERDDAPDDRKRKSRHLPCGAQVGMAGGQPKLEVHDEQQLRRWLQAYRPGVVTEQTRYVWSKREVAQLRDEHDQLVATDPETGELVPARGARVVREPSFYVKPADNRTNQEGNQ